MKEEKFFYGATTILNVVKMVNCLFMVEWRGRGKDIRTTYI